MNNDTKKYFYYVPVAEKLMKMIFPSHTTHAEYMNRFNIQGDIIRCLIENENKNSDKKIIETKTPCKMKAIYYFSIIALVFAGVFWVFFLIYPDITMYRDLGICGNIVQVILILVGYLENKTNKPSV